MYSKLDDTFKQNYFNTLAKFETYMKQHFYANNQVKYGSFEKSGQIYVYHIRISDRNNENAQVISMKILMQLKTGTDFVMSFSVE